MLGPTSTSLKEVQNLRRLDAGLCEHDFGCVVGYRVGLCVVEVHNLSDARLDDDLGTLVAREERCVEGAVSNVGRVLVEDSVQFGVADCRGKKNQWE